MKKVICSTPPSPTRSGEKAEPLLDGGLGVVNQPTEVRAATALSEAEMPWAKGALDEQPKGSRIPKRLSGI